MEDITVGSALEPGFILDYWKCHPAQKIVKIQGELDEQTVSLRVSVNVAYSGELFFEDTAILDDGDSIYAEPDGLTVLKSGADISQIDRINGERVQIGVYIDGTFLAHPTTEA